MKKTLFIVLGLIVLGSVGYVAMSKGWFWFVEPSQQEFPVRGVDISHHQGEIDWKKIEEQGIHFAYMKATEGGDFKDTRFQDNWKRAKQTGLRIGAYHFFTSQTDGLLQAENFIHSVPREAGMLPPVIDVENDIVTDLSEQQKIRDRLGVLLKRIENYYGTKPIIYTDEDAYPVYVAPQFKEYPLWYRSIYGKPDLRDGAKWVIW